MAPPFALDKPGFLALARRSYHPRDPIVTFDFGLCSSSFSGLHMCLMSTLKPEGAAASGRVQRPVGIMAHGRAARTPQGATDLPVTNQWAAFKLRFSWAAARRIWHRLDNHTAALPRRHFSTHLPGSLQPIVAAWLRVDAFAFSAFAQFSAKGCGSLKTRYRDFVTLLLGAGHHRQLQPSPATPP